MKLHQNLALSKNVNKIIGLYTVVNLFIGNTIPSLNSWYLLQAKKMHVFKVYFVLKLFHLITQNFKKKERKRKKKKSKIQR